MHPAQMLYANSFHSSEHLLKQETKIDDRWRQCLVQKASVTYLCTIIAGCVALSCSDTKPVSRESDK
jgi:hypothetical protein